MQFKTSEVVILLIVALMSFIANLPEHIIGKLVDRNLIIGALVAVVVISLFRYLQVMLLLVISILAIGANLPSELANQFGISQMTMLVSLGVLVAVGLMNRAIKLLPASREELAEHAEAQASDAALNISDSRQVMLTAIARGDRETLTTLLARNANVNFSQGGTTPLHLATEKGYPDIVRALIAYGADPNAKNAKGQTALESALALKKYVQTTEVLFNATTFEGSKPQESKLQTSLPAEPRRSEEVMWKQLL